MADGLSLDKIFHPDYKREISRWNTLEDFGVGGEAVTEPGHETGKVHFWQDNGGEDKESPEKNYAWTPRKSEAYLFSHERESWERWSDRCARAEHIPVCQPVLDIMTTGILRSAPQRLEMKGFWEGYVEDVDMCGQNINDFMFDSLFAGLNLGRVHALTDMPKTDRQLESLADQLESGIRPYSFLVQPQDLVDWKLDQYGRFEWIRLREEMEPERSYAVEAGPVVYAYKVWTRNEWIRFEPKFDDKGAATEGSYFETERVSHDLGVVPLATFFTKRYKRTLRSRSMVNSLVDIDRAVFNKMSLLDEIDYAQTFSQLAIPDNSQMGIHGLRTGLYEAFTFDPEGGPPVYLAPNPEMAAGLWARIVELFHTARVIAGVSRGRAEQSKEERSAAALGQEASDKHAQMVQHATTAEEFERTLYDHVGAWMKNTDLPRIEYNRKFEVRSLEEKLASALTIKTLQPGPVAMSAVNQAVVGEWLRQCGVEDKTVDEALKDIETYSEEMAAALPQMQEGDDEEDEKQGGAEDE